MWRVVFFLTFRLAFAVFQVRRAHVSIFAVVVLLRLLPVFMAHKGVRFLTCFAV